MLNIKEELEKLNYNEYQINTLLNIEEDSNWIHVPEKMLLDYKEGKLEEEKVKEYLTQVIIEINLDRLLGEHKERMEKNGYTVTVVGGERATAYTVGLSVSEGYELVTQSNIAGKVLGIVINAVVGELRDSGFEENLTLKTFNINNTEARCKLVEVKDVEWLGENITYGMFNSDWLETKPTKVYQVLLGDKNNILPGENGYDVSFEQTLVGI